MRYSVHLLLKIVQPSDRYKSENLFFCYVSQLIKNKEKNFGRRPK